MQYRDQLEYIKSHGESERNNKRRKKKRKLNFFDKLFWMLFFIVSVLFIVIMWYVDFFPIPYLVGVGGILLSLLMIIKIMQQRACRHHKRKPKGTLLALLCTVAVAFGGFYLIKINSAMDQVAIGEESGNYEELHERNVTEQSFNIYIIYIITILTIYKI